MPRPTLWTRDGVLAAAAPQLGLLTASQLTALGVRRSTLGRSDQLGGMFSRVLPGVHRVDGHGRLTDDQRRMAALLYAGPDSALTGADILRRGGVHAASEPALRELDRVHVLVPHARQRASHGFVTVERTHAMPRHHERDGLRIATMARVVLDAVRRCTDEEAVRAVIFEVVQRGLAAPEALEDERRRGQVRGSRFARLALEEVFGGVRSVPEADLRLAFQARGWNDLLFNPRLHLSDGTFLACPDVYHLSGVCLEVDSREHHFAVASWEATMRRHTRMTAHGLAVLHVPPSRINTDVHSVLAEFEQAVDVRRGLPAPPIVLRMAA
jgi:hypothetical protein